MLKIKADIIKWGMRSLRAKAEWSVGYSGDEDDALLSGDLLGPPLDGLGRRLDADPRHRHRHLKLKSVRHCGKLIF